jgi:hypothetical protein
MVPSHFAKIASQVNDSVNCVIDPITLLSLIWGLSYRIQNNSSPISYLKAQIMEKNMDQATESRCHITSPVTQSQPTEDQSISGMLSQQPPRGQASH